MKNLQLRANFGATQRNLRIDPKNLTLQNVVAMQEGEALGHQMWADRRTLEMIVELGNSSPKGISISKNLFLSPASLNSVPSAKRI